MTVTSDSLWEIVLGSGYRGTVDALDEPQREALRGRVTEGLRAWDETAVRTDVVHVSRASDRESVRMPLR